MQCPLVQLKNVMGNALCRGISSVQPHESTETRGRCASPLHETRVASTASSHMGSTSDSSPRNGSPQLDAIEVNANGTSPVAGRVLFADDSETQRKLVRRFLERDPLFKELEIDTFSDGDDVVEIASTKTPQSFNPELVVLDYDMQRSTGESFDCGDACHAEHFIPSVQRRTLHELRQQRPFTLHFDSFTQE